MPREEDHGKFKELAIKRVKRALKDLQLIGNLANKSNYYYTDDDQKKILRALKQGIADVEQRFRTKGSDDDIDFTL